MLDDINERLHNINFTIINNMGCTKMVDKCYYEGEERNSLGTRI